MIRQELENPLAKRILAGTLGPGDSVTVDVAGQRFTFMRGERTAVEAAAGPIPGHTPGHR